MHTDQSRRLKGQAKPGSSKVAAGLGQGQGVGRGQWGEPAVAFAGQPLAIAGATVYRLGEEPPS